MQNDKKLSAGAAFFLGANTPGGFYSLFDELCDPADGWRLYIIKGGPGTGKSTLLKKIAAEADRRGLYCERIHCSSDPASLDGVIVPSLKLSAADGTAPHVLEPKYPGVCETLVDLGAFRNDARLRENAEEIIRLTEENRAAHLSCTRFLNAAGYAEKDLVKLAAGALDMEKTQAFASHLCRRELGAGAGGSAAVRRRFLSAFTPGGVHVFYGTAETLCERQIVLADEFGLAAAVIVETLCAAALEAGYSVIRCLCPLSPESKTDHILIPELSLGVFTSNARHPFSFENERRVQCARFMNAAELRAHRNRLHFIARARAEMLDAALERLRGAKALHDRLEEYYTAAMDFEAAARYGEDLIAEMFE